MRCPHAARHVRASHGVRPRCAACIPHPLADVTSTSSLGDAPSHSARRPAVGDGDDDRQRRRGDRRRRSIRRARQRHRRRRLRCDPSARRRAARRRRHGARRGIRPAADPRAAHRRRVAQRAPSTRRARCSPAEPGSSSCPRARRPRTARVRAGDDDVDLAARPPADSTSIVPGAASRRMRGRTPAQRCPRRRPGASTSSTSPCRRASPEATGRGS